MKKHYIKRVIIVLLVAAVLCGVYFLINRLGPMWAQNNQEKRALPKIGEYWNNELELYLNFSIGGTEIEDLSGKTESMNIHPAGRLVNQDGTFNAWYRWDRKADEVILKIITYQEEYIEDREYAFIPVD